MQLCLLSSSWCGYRLGLWLLFRGRPACPPSALTPVVMLDTGTHPAEKLPTQKAMTSIFSSQTRFSVDCRSSSLCWDVTAGRGGRKRKQLLQPALMLTGSSQSPAIAPFANVAMCCCMFPLLQDLQTETHQRAASGGEHLLLLSCNWAFWGYFIFLLFSSLSFKICFFFLIVSLSFRKKKDTWLSTTFWSWSKKPCLICSVLIL